MSGANGPVERRIRRRELLSPRSTAAIAVAVIVILLAAWVGTELTLSLLGYLPLLVTPEAMIAAATQVPQLPQAPVVAGAAVAALLGIWALVLAVTPGRRPRHVLQTQRAVVIADDEVIASALARHAAHVAQVSPDSTRVTMSPRSALVEIVPASGIPVDAAAVRAVVDEQMTAFDVRPAVRSRVRVAAVGKVGA